MGFQYYKNKLITSFTLLLGATAIIINFDQFAPVDILYLFTIRQALHSMDSDTKKKLIIAGSLGLALLTGIFIKNKIEESRFKALPRDTVIVILKKTRKENFGVFKQVASMATQMSVQMKLSQIDPQMVKAYLEAPQSPINIAEIFETNYAKVCEAHQTTYSHFNESVEHYVRGDDKQIQRLVEDCEKDYETSLSGKLPEVKVVVPPSLTKARLIQIQKKLTLKRYLLQVDVFRKVRGKSQQELMSDPELLKGLQNPESEQQKILEEEGLGQNDQPAAAVFQAAVTKLKNDTDFRQNIAKIETHYAKIFNKYKVKLQQNKISENELHQLEDELIYSQLY